jgi:hypothetical protein
MFLYHAETVTTIKGKPGLRGIRFRAWTRDTAKVRAMSHFGFFLPQTIYISRVFLGFKWRVATVPGLKIQ